MKTERNIFIAFILNLIFSILELIGGLITGSVAIVSDAIHDAGDAASIGISFFLEKKSKQKPDKTHTFGYARYSVVGSLIKTLILIFGSVMMIYTACSRMILPTEINYDGMIGFSILGISINLCATFFTRGKGSLNQKAVNLHMLEDCLGWFAVLIGAITMKFTGFSRLDPMISIGLSILILINALANLKQTMDLFLEKTPQDIDLEEIVAHISMLDGVMDVHHIHIWSLDGRKNCATMHVVTKEASEKIKQDIRAELQEHGIGHVTLELEFESESCSEKQCGIASTAHTEYRCCHHSH